MEKADRKLRSKYVGNSGEVDQEMTVKKKVKETERNIWEAGMQTKSALEMYRLCKTDIDREFL